MRLKVTVVGGMHAEVVGEVAARTLVAAPGRTAVLEHEMHDFDVGRIVRTVRDRAGSQHLVMELSHACVGCVLRESVVPALAECARHGRYDHVVLALPPAIEPDPVARMLVLGSHAGVAMCSVVDLHAVVTAVDPARVVSDADSGDWLTDRAIACAAGDDRFVAEVLLRQIEHADVLIASAGTGDGMELLAHLNPAALVVPLHAVGAILEGPRRHDPRAAALRAEGGVARAPIRSTGTVGSIVWHARRPMHPMRLRDALDALVPDVLRTRGHVWLATRPNVRYALSTSGPRFELTPAGGWTGADGRRGVGPAHAVFDLDPVLGDRGSELLLTGLHLDGGALHDLLDSTMLTAGEIAAGPTGWRAMADPFMPRSTGGRNPRPLAAAPAP